MTCVTSVKYKICNSGKEFSDIVPSRGLHQGDPLSSYLFLICTEGFSTIMRRYEACGLLGGIKVARGAPTISHMLFADNSYILCKANLGATSSVWTYVGIWKESCANIGGDQRKRIKTSIGCLGRECANQKQQVEWVFKARYYPTGNYLGAKLGESPSFVWRSIMEAQNVLKADAVRLVGDGTTISVLKDPWLPHPTNAFVTTNSEALHGATFNSLFEIGEHKWDEELISDIFEDRDERDMS
ncbi:uncharacterized protein LOC141719436 [Apium graveolens]|uniref:uncharacterized protein LOC141719436 n=1 Tax=Apium graveolens TaxID=4045 RepID=UPI003D7A70D1